MQAISQQSAIVFALRLGVNDQLRGIIVKNGMSMTSYEMQLTNIIQ